MSTNLDAYLGLPADVRVPNPAATRARAIGRAVLSRDPPGPWNDNHLAQSEHYRGVAYLCIRAISDGLSQATVRISRRRRRKSTNLAGKSGNRLVRKALPTAGAEPLDHEWEPVDFSHPVHDLFECPNDVDTWGDFITKWVIQSELTGTAIIWPLTDRLGNPREMWVIPTGLTQQIPMSTYMPFGGLYVQSFYPGVVATYGAFPGSMTLDNRDILRFKNVAPLYQWDGYSPLTAGAVQLDVLQAIDQGRKNSMDNGWSPDVMVTLEGATLDECDRTQVEMQNRNTGTKGRKVFVAAAEGVEAKLLTTSAKDMDYPSGWDQMVRFACALWQTNSTVIGLDAADSYASFYAKLKQRNIMCLQPRARHICDFLNKHLIWPKYGRRFRVEIDLPTIDDQQLLDAQLKQDGDLGTITYNEYRASRGRDPVGPEGDVPVKIYVDKVAKDVNPEPEPAAMPGMNPAMAPPIPVPSPGGSGSLPPKSVVKSMIAGVLKGIR